MRSRNCWGALAAAVFAVACSPHQSAEQTTPGDSPDTAVTKWTPMEGTPTEADYPELDHLMQLTDGIYSGAEPKTEEAFASLAALGVKTIVSVDGASPNLELAEQYGLRYVHIPVGYDGIDEKAGASLARLVQDVDGPMYIHCHHGVHRGPAAAAVACIASGEVANAAATGILEAAGTSRNYAGLWNDVANYVAPEPGTQLPELVPVAEVDSVAAAMAKVDRANDHLILCRDAGWKAPENHPDLIPVTEAVLVNEGLRETARNVQFRYDERFDEWLAAAEAEAEAFVNALRAKRLDEADRLFEAMNASCKKCHNAYRNAPEE